MVRLQSTQYHMPSDRCRVIAPGPRFAVRIGLDCWQFGEVEPLAFVRILDVNWCPQLWLTQALLRGMGAQLANRHQ